MNFQKESLILSKEKFSKIITVLKSLISSAYTNECVTAPFNLLHDEANVFNACNDAINEINKLIEDLHKTFSGVELFVTADHGFFYKYDKLDSSDLGQK